ncbi:MAG TPA: PIN domain-containing protein [Streptosporangiaceae bacterium]|nr:PIN domain-containing protein [Streptosporangiaceae bacterium]
MSSSSLDLGRNGVSPLALAPTVVVFDVNVLVSAAASGNSPFRSWPSPPPVSGNPSADCLGIVVDAAEFALWLSPHILTNVERVLAELFKWAQNEIEAYLAAVVAAAEHSGGGVAIDVPRTVSECADYEDNLNLDLATEVGAFIVVSNDTDLLSMSPWRGTPVIGPAAFASKVDAMRRHSRRRHR